MNKQRNVQMHGGISGAAVAIRVKLSDGVNRVSRILDDGTVEITLNTPDSSAEAVNNALVRYLAMIGALNPNNIEVVAGEDSDKKLVTYTNVDKEKVHQSITDQLTA